MATSPSPQNSSSTPRLAHVLRERPDVSSDDTSDELDEWRSKVRLALEREDPEMKRRDAAADVQRKLNTRLKQENEELKNKIVDLATTISKLHSRNEERTKEVRRLRSKVDNAKKDARDIQCIADPNTLEGQEIGAILRIKKTTELVNRNGFAVGDLVRVLDKGVFDFGFGRSGFPLVNNIRLGSEGEIEWESFFPVSRTGTCYCLDSGYGIEMCRCIHEGTKIITRPHQNDVKTTDPDAKRYLSPLEISDPSTPEGQMPGAILAIKANVTKQLWEKGLQVGDCVRVLSHAFLDCKVRGMKSGNVENFVPWECFLPVAEGDSCICNAYEACRCEYKGSKIKKRENWFILMLDAAKTYIASAIEDIVLAVTAVLFCCFILASGVSIFLFEPRSPFNESQQVDWIGVLQHFGKAFVVAWKWVF